VVKNASPGPNHRRTHENRVGERGPHRQFAFAALADVERRRGRVGANSRDLDEPLDSVSLRARRHAARRLHVHGVERAPAPLDVEADRVDYPVSAGECIRNGPLIVNVGRDRLKLRIVRTEQCAAAVRMP
jgi:hypothetical protein